MSQPTEIKWKIKPKCKKCNIDFDTPYLWCPECNGLIEIAPLRVPVVPKEIQRRAQISPSIWNYHEFLPEFSHHDTLCEGHTPIIELKNLETLRGVLVKLEFRSPSGSFRDRASPLIIADAKAKLYDKIINSSTGSYSISLAAYCARAGLDSINVIPRKMELSKIEQMKVYGSRVEERGENFSESIRATKDFIKMESYYFPTPSKNLLTIEGQKTLGLEIAIQLPDVEDIIAPMGSGSLIYSMYRGLQDAAQSGWIAKIPRIHSVSLKDTQLSKIVESLEITETEMLDRAEQIVKETGGVKLIIKPKEMIDQALELARNEGLFIEPASASVICGMKAIIEEKKVPNIKKNKFLAVLTGSGLNAMNIFASNMRDVKKSVWGLSQTSTLKFEILNLIHEETATSGAGIWTAMGRETRSKQSIYLQLDDLELKGLIQIEDRNKKPRKYSLTPKGLEMLEKKRDLMDIL